MMSYMALVNRDTGVQFSVILECVDSDAFAWASCIVTWARP